MVPDETIVQSPSKITQFLDVCVNYNSFYQVQSPSKITQFLDPQFLDLELKITHNSNYYHQTVFVILYTNLDLLSKDLHFPIGIYLYFLKGSNEHP